MRPAGEILGDLRKLPFGSRDDMLQGQRALILAPHPDDETLGCGGLIAACCAAGAPPLVAILTDGAASHPGSVSYPPARLRGVREAEVRLALHRLGLPPECALWLGYEDTKLPGEGAAFHRITATLADLAVARHCGVIIAPWAADPHGDHEAAAAIGAAVAVGLGLRLLSYPVWGWLLDPEVPLQEVRRGGWRLDIAAYLPVKRHALAAHRSQYGGLIEDAPDGFVLPAELLAVFDEPYEVFIA